MDPPRRFSDPGIENLSSIDANVSECDQDFWSIVANWLAVKAFEVQISGRPVEVKSAGTYLRLRAAVELDSKATLLLNPYGPGLSRFLLETANVPRPFITEWAALAEGSVDVHYTRDDLAPLLPDAVLPPNHQEPLDLPDDQQSCFPE